MSREQAPIIIVFSSLHRQILSMVTHVHIHLLPNHESPAPLQKCKHLPLLPPSQSLFFHWTDKCADCDPVTVFITMPHPLLPRSWLPSQCLRTIFHVSVCLTVSILMFETAICSQSSPCGRSLDCAVCKTFCTWSPIACSGHATPVWHHECVVF